MKRYWLSLVLTLFCVSNLLAQNTALPTFTVTRYGAIADDGIDDTAAIRRAYAAAVAYQAGADKQVQVLFPRGTFILQDATTATTLDNSSFGGIIVLETVSHVTFTGEDAVLQIGTNGFSTASIRIFGDNCTVQGITFDTNRSNAPATDDTPTIPGDFATKGNSGIEINGTLGGGSYNKILNCKAINGSKPNVTYATGTITVDADVGTAANDVVTLSGGTWPLWIDVDADLYISGVRHPVTSRTSNSVIVISSQASDIVTPTAFSIVGEPYVGGGEEDFLIVSGIGNRIHNCISTDAAWQAFRVGGDWNEIVGCTAINHRGNGLRVVQGAGIFIDRFYSDTNKNSGRSNIILDAGSSDDSTPLDVSDRRTPFATIQNCFLRSTSDGDFEGGCSVLKIAATDRCMVRNCYIESGIETNNVAFRVEDAIDDMTMYDCTVVGQMLYTPGVSSGVVTAVTSYASGIDDIYDGKCALAIAGDVWQDGKSIYVRGSSESRYNREHIAVRSEGGLVVTDVDFITSTIGSSMWAHGGVDNMTIENCTFFRGQHDFNYFLENVTSPNIRIDNNHFEMTTAKAALVKEGGILAGCTSDTGIQKWKMTDNLFLFNTDKLSRCIRNNGEAGTTEVQRVTVTNNGGTPGGTFTLSLSGYGTTGAISWNATTATLASNMQTALRTLAGLESVTVAFTSGDYTAGAIFTVTLTGTLGNQSQLVAIDSMTGTTHSLAVATTTEGAQAVVWLTSGKIVSYGNTFSNKSTGAVWLANVYGPSDTTQTYDERLILFASDGDRPKVYAWDAYPVDATMTWSAGDYIRNSAPSLGEPSGWVCVVAGSPGTWQAIDERVYPYKFLATNSTTVASTSAPTSATPTTGIGALQFGGLRALEVGETIDFSASGIYSTTATPGLEFGIKLGKQDETGATTLISATFTTPSGASNLKWQLSGRARVKTVAVSGAVRVDATIAYETAAGSYTEAIVAADVTVDTATITHNRKMDVFADWSAASASNTLTCERFEVKPW